MVEEFRGLWQYRHLVLQLVSRNIKTRYKRSVLGVAWTMLNPLLTMLVLTLVFSQIFRFSVASYPVYLLSSLLLWNYFSQTTVSSMSELVWGGGLLGRIYIPRAIFAMTAVGTGLFNLVLSLVPLVLIMVVSRVPLQLALLFLPVPILLTTMFILGLGLFLSALAVYFVDVLSMYEITLTIWFYLTPILYPPDILPEGLKWVLAVNPMTYYVQLFRLPVLDGAVPGFDLLLPAVGYAITALGVGWWFFTRRADEFAYRV